MAAGKCAVGFGEGQAIATLRAQKGASLQKPRWERVAPAAHRRTRAQRFVGTGSWGQGIFCDFLRAFFVGAILATLLAIFAIPRLTTARLEAARS